MRLCEKCYARENAIRDKSDAAIAERYGISVDVLRAAIEESLQACDPIWVGHPTKHMDIVDACIDVGIYDFVEYVNKNICATRFSCQGGGPGLDGLPMITIAADDFYKWAHLNWSDSILTNPDITVWTPPGFGVAHITFVKDPWELV
jgi:hypothetical protein